jgi:hypothetical protein
MEAIARHAWRQSKSTDRDGSSIDSLKFGLQSISNRQLMGRLQSEHLTYAIHIISGSLRVI